MTAPALGKSAQTIPTIVDALRAILAEITPGIRPYSTDSWLPEHIVKLANQALQAHDRQSLAAHQHAFNAMSTASWHVARGELPQALSRLRRANSHITAALEGGAE